MCFSFQKCCTATATTRSTASAPWDSSSCRTWGCCSDSPSCWWSPFMKTKLCSTSSFDHSQQSVLLLRMSPCSLASVPCTVSTSLKEKPVACTTYKFIDLSLTTKTSAECCFPCMKGSFTNTKLVIKKGGNGTPRTSVDIGLIKTFYKEIII